MENFRFSENWLIFVGGQKSTPGSIFYGDVHLPDRSGRVFHHKRIQSPVSRHSVLVTAPLRLLIHPVLLSGCRLVVTKQIDFFFFLSRSTCSSRITISKIGKLKINTGDDQVTQIVIIIHFAFFQSIFFFSPFQNIIY